MLKRVLAAMAVVAILIAGGYYTQKNHSSPKPAVKGQIQKADTVTVTLKTTNDSAKTNNSYDVKKDSTVLQLMEKAKQKGQLEYVTKESSYGVFVDSINGIKNDETVKKYWTLYVNGKMASEGAGTQKIAAKDIVEWKFESITM